MKRELDMSIDWRTVQLFIGKEGVSEVAIDAEDNRNMICSCKAYKNNSKCKHTKFVKARIEESNGNYSVMIPEEVPDEDAIVAMSDPTIWREFVIKYGEVEVL